MIDEFAKNGNLIHIARHKPVFQMKLPLPLKLDYDYLILDIQLKKTDKNFINEKKFMEVTFAENTKVKDSFISQNRVIYVVSKSENNLCE